MLNSRASHLEAGGAVREPQANVEQPGQLPEGLKGSVVKQPDWGLH